MRKRREARSWILDKCSVYFFHSSLFLHWCMLTLGHGRYKSSDILLLPDDSKDPRSLPTRDNLIQAMRWLVRGAKKDDSLFFHCKQFFLSYIFSDPRFMNSFAICSRSCHPDRWHLPRSHAQRPTLVIAHPQHLRADNGWCILICSRLFFRFWSWRPDARSGWRWGGRLGWR